MKVTITAAEDLGASDIARWHQLQDEDRRLDNAFFSPEFAQAVGRYRTAVRVAVLEDGQHIVGFLPFERNRYVIGRAVGLGVSDAQGLVATKDIEVHWPQVLAAARLDYLEFDHLATWQATCPSWHASSVGSPIADLDEGYETYERARRLEHRERFKGFDKRFRRMTRELGETEFTFAETTKTSMQAMSGWKSAQYRSSGYRDIWSLPWYRDLVEDLAHLSTPYLRGAMSAVKGTENRPIAVQLSLQSRNTLAGWITTYDPELARYSPGITLLRNILRSCHEESFARYEFGKGDETFKQQFKTGNTDVAKAWLARRSATAVLHRARVAPREHAEQFVLRRPALRARARATLQTVGRLRTQLS